MEPLQLTSGWSIPARDLRVRFVRSGGPGGQNVNKVATKVELRLDMRGTEALSAAQKARFEAMFPAALTRDGEVILTGDEHRSQAMNLQATRERLREMVLRVRRPPRTRRPTKPSRAARKRRLDDKRHRSRVKALRSNKPD